MMTQRLFEQLFCLGYIFLLIISFSLFFHKHKRVRKVFQSFFCELYDFVVLFFFVEIIYIFLRHHVSIWISLCTLFNQLGSALFFACNIVISDKVIYNIFIETFFMAF